MFIYYAMFGLVLLVGATKHQHNTRAKIIAVAVIFALIIGFRYEVGADWERYLFHYRLSFRADLLEWKRISPDLGYALANWLSRQLGGGIVGVNLICGGILMAGIARYALSQPSPWLVMVAATPYLAIVIGMGYTRQATAVGFELLALVSLFHGKPRNFILFVLFGALFHKSVLVVLPLAVVGIRERNSWHRLWIVVTTAVAGYYLLAEHTEYYWNTYLVSDHYDSQGALVRLAMNAASGLFVLIYRRTVCLTRAEYRFWTVLALLTFLTFPMTVVSSTAADRLGIYLIPIQLFVCGRLVLVTKTPIFERLAVVGYGAVLLVWMNFAAHAYSWIPYQLPPWLH